MLCACKIPLRQKTSNSVRNPLRDYYICWKIEANEPYSCKTWLWVDLVADYVEKIIKFRTRILQAKHGRELAAVREECSYMPYEKNKNSSGETRILYKEDMLLWSLTHAVFEFEIGGTPHQSAATCLEQ
ncbi:hypothetical protein QYE76_013588 [Lolium multiflorum]|uniref:Uncharacterized protein n=1 Tax=Lolium multiflorum TaxID=4521 RepID=A0AAD8TZ48_LOLMU|nr:hypothetical protein QYE76_013588 [Lolium multiflorum]